MVEVRAAEALHFEERQDSSLTTLKQNAAILLSGFMFFSFRGNSYVKHLKIGACIHLVT